MMLSLLLLGCHDYALYAIPEEPTLNLAPQPDTLPDDAGDAYGVWDDVVHGEVEVEDDDEITGEPEGGGGDIPAIEEEVEEPELSECAPGYRGTYFNLPAHHPEVIGAVPGLRPGDVPEAHDWFSAGYFDREQVDASLLFGEAWWPVDGGEPGDPAHYAVRWEGWFELGEAQSVTFFFGTDDDGWVLIDGQVVADQGGVHALEERCYSAALGAGLHRIEIYTADREASASGLWFEWEDPVDVFACDAPT